MLKIQAFYRTQEDLEKADEPYKSVATILDKLYLKGPNGNNNLSYQGFTNVKAVSCIRDMAEDLAKSQVSFVSRMKTLWHSLLNPQKHFTDTFDNYSVPFEYYQGTIFGGVYYALAKQNKVDEEHLGLMESFISNFPEAVPYFNVFKKELIGNTLPLAPRPSSHAVIRTTSIATLRKQFIHSLNSNLVPIDSVDWADATIGFDRNVMKEFFWGIDNDKVLKNVVKAIIRTWNKLAEAKDSRCIEVIPSTTLGINIDPWKFGGLTKETINKFFDDLWVERNARNTYAAFCAGNSDLPKDESVPPKDVCTSDINVEKSETDNTSCEVVQLREELAKAISDKEAMVGTIDSLKNDLLAFKTRDKKGKDIPLFTAKQVSIILKALFLENNSLTNNAKNLAPLVQRFGGGWAPTTAENALGYEVTQDECDEIAKVFNDFAPKISIIIKAYPENFKKIKGNKLQNNLKP